MCDCRKLLLLSLSLSWQLLGEVNGNSLENGCISVYRNSCLTDRCKNVSSLYPDAFDCTYIILKSVDCWNEFVERSSTIPSPKSLQRECSKPGGAWQSRRDGDDELSTVPMGTSGDKRKRAIALVHHSMKGQQVGSLPPSQA